MPAALWASRICRAGFVATCVGLAAGDGFTGGAIAHGGGLNAEGCHTNRKTSEYHCYRRSAPSPQNLLPQNLIDPKSVFQLHGSAHCRRRSCAPGGAGFGQHIDRDNDGIGCE
jgi:hypothetical protein